MKNKRDAFTLVELLVVISIIALLLSILMPSLAKVREMAKRTVCASQLHNMSLGLITYDVSNKQLPPGNWGSASMMGAHKLLAASYGIPIKCGTCPSVKRQLDPYFAWGITNSVYGQMTYNYLGGDGGGKNASQVDGWYVSDAYFWANKYGYRPYRSIGKGGKGMSQMPLMLDIAMWGDSSRTWGYYGSGKSNHIQGSGAKEKIGENVLFYDGHNEWQNMISKKSWRFGNDYYQAFYLTSPASPGTGPGLFWDLWGGGR